MRYTRSNPSPRYAALLQLYREAHVRGDAAAEVSADETFQGQSLGPHIGRIKRLVERTGAQNVLDYGCGKGVLYDWRDLPLPGGGTVESVQDFWGVDYVHLYDPGHAPYSKLPEGTFHGVVCTDVLEHVPADDLEWMLEEIFAYAERFVFVTIATYPARKSLPNGENAHVTQQPAEWWDDLLRRVAARHPALVWDARVELAAPGTPGFGPHAERRLGNA